MSMLDRRTLLRGVAAAPIAASLPRWVFAQNAGYEILQFYMPADVLPEDLLSGELHDVVGQVIAQGYSNKYMLRTDFDAGAVESQDLLEKRIHEAAAMEQLLKIKETKSFGAGAMAAAQSPYKAVKALVNDPVDTLMGVPEGAWILAQRLGEMISGDRGDQEDSFAVEILGFSTVKRKIAYRLGVDVYSANKRLQQEMNEVAFAGFAGGFTMNLALGAVTMPSGLAQAVNAAELARSANQIIRDSAPEDLRVVNRDMLLTMGLTKKEINKFMDNRNYTPRHETTIRLALENMEGVENRAQVIRSAQNADSHTAAQTTQRSVEMMRTYHATMHPGVAIEEAGENPALRTEDGRLAVFMAADELRWTERTSNAGQALAALPGDGVEMREIVLAGHASDRARSELTAMGLTVTENTRLDLLPQGEWAAPDLEAVETPEGEEGEMPADGESAPPANGDIVPVDDPA